MSRKLKKITLSDQQNEKENPRAEDTYLEGLPYKVEPLRKVLGRIWSSLMVPHGAVAETPQMPS